MGRRGWVLGWLMTLAVLALGCGEAEEACFEGPGVTYFFTFADFFSVDLALEGVEACIMLEDRACGCSRSNAMGALEIRLPAGEEVVVRLSGQNLISLYNFIPTPSEGDVLDAKFLAPRPLIEALAQSVGVAPVPGSGAVVANAVPVAGARLEGSVLRLLDLSGADVDVAAGPFYIDTDGELLDPEATSSKGWRVFAAWMNVPPGRYVVHGTGPAGSNLYEGCSPTSPRSGWHRWFDGELVLEMEAFEDAASEVFMRECVP
jgi:hypothetical protein